MSYYKKVTLPNGERVRVFATYGLDPVPTQRRTFLLHSTSRNARGILPEGLLAHWELYKRIVDDQFGGNFSQDKLAVKRIRENPRIYQYCGVVVHRFGPVPVFLTPVEQEVEIDGETVMGRLVLYYQRERPDDFRHQDSPDNYPDNEAFLYTLRDSLPQCMQRYLEDVTGMMERIQRRGNIRKSFKWAKEVEDEVGASIQSKLKAVVPSNLTESKKSYWRVYLNNRLDQEVEEYNKKIDTQIIENEKKRISRDIQAKKITTNSREKAKLSQEIKQLEKEIRRLERRKHLLPEEERRCEVYEQHHAYAFATQYARNLILYFLNELYRQMGLAERSAEYYDRFETIKKAYNESLGFNAAQQAMDSLSDLKCLADIRELYEQGDYRDLYDLEASSIWVARLKAFAKFLILMKENQVPAEKGRIFISYRNGVRSSQILLEQIKNFYAEHYGEQLTTLAMTSTGYEDYTLTDSICKMIWQADRTFCIITKEREGHPNGSSDFGWILREADHTLGMSKPVMYLRENGFDKGGFERELASEGPGFFHRNEKKDAKRMEQLAKDYRDFKQLDFSVNPKAQNPYDWRHLAAEIQERLHLEAQKAIRQRHDRMVLGLLSQMSEKTVVMLKLMDMYRDTTSYYNKKEWVDRTYRQGMGDDFNKSGLRKVFENAWANVNERQLYLGGKRLTVIESEGKGRGKTYRYNLHGILRLLQPELEDERLVQWAGDILNRTLPDKYQRFFKTDVEKKS